MGKAILIIFPRGEAEAIFQVFIKWGEKFETLKLWIAW